MSLIRNYILEPVTSEGNFSVLLDKEIMLATRHKLGFLNDRDAFEINK